MATSKANYVHSTIYQFNEEGQQAIVNEFRSAVGIFPAWCWYDVDLHTFQITCPSNKYAAEASAILDDLIASYVQEETDAAEREEREPRVRRFAVSDPYDLDISKDERAQRNVRRPGTTTPLVRGPVLHHISADAAITKSLQFFALSDLPPTLSGRFHAAIDQGLSTTSDLTCRVTRWSSPPDRYVFNGRQGPSSVTVDPRIQAIIDKRAFPRRDGCIPRDAEISPSTLDRFNITEQTAVVQEYIEGISDVPPEEPEYMPAAPTDAENFRRQPRIGDQSSVRIPVKLSEGVDSTSQAEEDDDSSSEASSSSAEDGITYEQMIARGKEQRASDAAAQSDAVRKGKQPASTPETRVPGARENVKQTSNTTLASQQQYRSAPFLDPKEGWADQNKQQQAEPVQWRENARPAREDMVNNNASSRAAFQNWRRARATPSVPGSRGRGVPGNSTNSNIPWQSLGQSFSSGRRGNSTLNPSRGSQRRRNRNRGRARNTEREEKSSPPPTPPAASRPRSPSPPPPEDLIDFSEPSSWTPIRPPPGFQQIIPLPSTAAEQMAKDANRGLDLDDQNTFSMAGRAVKNTETGLPVYNENPFNGQLRETERQSRKKYVNRQGAGKKGKDRSGQISEQKPSLPLPDPVPPPKRKEKEREKPQTAKVNESKEKEHPSNVLPIIPSGFEELLRDTSLSEGVSTSLRVQFGLILITLPAESKHLKGNHSVDSFQEKLKDAEAFQWTFSPKLTTSGNDAAVILDRFAPGYYEIAQDYVQYEIHVRTRDGHAKIIRFDPAKKFEPDLCVFEPSTTIRTLLNHYPMHVWDVRATLETTPPLVEPDPAFTRFVSTMQTFDVPSEAPIADPNGLLHRGPSFQAIVPQHIFTIQKVIAKRCFERDLGPFKLLVTEIRDTLIAPANVPGFNFQAVSLSNADMARAARLWWECELRVPMDAVPGCEVVQAVVDKAVAEFDAVGIIDAYVECTPEADEVEPEEVQSMEAVRW